MMKTIRIITGLAVIAAGCALLVMALVTPPPGEIDHTVLMAFGEMATFAGASLGIGGKGLENEISKSKEQDHEKN